MRGYDVIVRSHAPYFAKDAATALRYAEYWASVGCDALFFEAEDFGDHHFARYGRVSYKDMRERIYYDGFIEYGIREAKPDPLTEHNNLVMRKTIEFIMEGIDESDD